MAIAEAIDANKPVTGQPHRWKKGESGNPSGRPAIKREVRELAKAMCPEAMQTLGQIMRDKKQPGSARVAACKEVFDRAMGRAEQHHKVSGRIDFAHLLAEYTEQHKAIEHGTVIDATPIAIHNEGESENTSNNSNLDE